MIIAERFYPCYNVGSYWFYLFLKVGGPHFFCFLIGEPANLANKKIDEQLRFPPT